MVERNLYTNRLIKEKSPYLLQHAHNPVDWYPWGNEAFNAAKEQDKPIFLSIGYATCHWCHVMEHESFENLEVAQMMNETFINIKVDREELPEVDSLYMEFAQSMMSGAAGWPLNVILTPNLEPFFASTYLPPSPQHGLMGLDELIERIQNVWQGDERERVMAQAGRIVEVFQENVSTHGDDLPLEESVHETAELLFKLSDSTYGGLKGHPKFPIGYQYNFLLRYSSKHQDSRALFLVERTLDMMQRGGIYDHLGGGFSRYSVDEKWLIPHFEKMLYDNALLIDSYLEAWQVTKKALYRTICCDIIDYILRDMTHPEGGFYSAEDADSEGHEGYYYTWTWEEIQETLTGPNVDLFCLYYGITPEGNFEGRNVLHTPERLEEFCAEHKEDFSKLQMQFEDYRNILKQKREKREHPFKDDKILSGWNGLMIYSLAEAAASFQDIHYQHAAEKAAQFIQAHLWKNGKLMRRWREGEAQFSAGLDEYAFMIRALISLFEITQKTAWLAWAMEMTSILETEFKSQEGAFYQTDGKDPSIILRKCQFSDGAEPSGNAVQCENLLRLYQLTQNSNYIEQAEDVLKAAKFFIDQYPPAYAYNIMNIDRYYDHHAPTFVVALNAKQEYLNELKQAIFGKFIPHRVVIWREENDIELFKLLPFIEQQGPINGKTTLYICHEGVCKAPITDLETMKTTIAKA